MRSYEEQNTFQILSIKSLPRHSKIISSAHFFKVKYEGDEKTFSSNVASFRTEIATRKGIHPVRIIHGSITLHLSARRTLKSFPVHPLFHLHLGSILSICCTAAGCLHVSTKGLYDAYRRSLETPQTGIRRSRIRPTLETSH